MNPTAQIWMMLASEGGRWSAAEVADRLNDLPCDTVAAVKSMAIVGGLRKYEKTGEAGSRVRYGVTTTCRVPQGLTVQDLADCGLLRIERESEAA